VSPQICDTLTPAHSTIACHQFQGSFVSPMRVALSARVSPHDQHTLAMHMDALRAFATRCGWTVIDTSAAMGSSVTDHRSKHPALLHAARQDACGRAGGSARLVGTHAGGWGGRPRPRGRPRSRRAAGSTPLRGAQRRRPQGRSWRSHPPVGPAVGPLHPGDPSLPRPPQELPAGRCAEWGGQGATAVPARRVSLRRPPA